MRRRRAATDSTANLCGKAASGGTHPILALKSTAFDVIECRKHRIEWCQARRVMSQPLLTSEKLARSTVLIRARVSGGGEATGTGFYYSIPLEGGKSMPIVVTNRHVVANASEGVLLHRYRAAGDSADTMLEQRPLDFESQWTPHPDSTVDLCAMRIGDVHAQCRELNGRLAYASLGPNLIPSAADSSALGAIEHIVMVGYPQGLWDNVNNMPVIRRGITATHPSLSWQGRKEFLIDAACFPGSSGSPVFLCDVGAHETRSGDLELARRVLFLGILYAGPYAPANVSFSVKPQLPITATVHLPSNLGFVIRSDQMVGLTEAVLDCKP
jgi:hypothetical protein